MMDSCVLIVQRHKQVNTCDITIAGSSATGIRDFPILFSKLPVNTQLVQHSMLNSD